MFEKFCTLARDAEGPAVFIDAGEVEDSFFFAQGGGAEEALEYPYKREVEFRGKVPERLQVLGFEAVNEAHGGYEACFGCCAADVKEVRISAGAEGAKDAAMEGNFGGEIGEVEVACRGEFADFDVFHAEGFREGGEPFFEADLEGFRFCEDKARGVRADIEDLLLGADGIEVLQDVGEDFCEVDHMAKELAALFDFSAAFFVIFVCCVLRKVFFCQFFYGPLRACYVGRSAVHQARPGILHIQSPG